MLNKKPIEDINWWNKWEKWITGASIAVVISALSYGLAFSYEFGFFNYFGIPRNLIEISLTNIFIAIFKLLIILIFAILPLYFIMRKVIRLPQEWRLWLSVYLGGILVFVVLVVLYQGFRLSDNWKQGLLLWTIGWVLAVCIVIIRKYGPSCFRKILKRKPKEEIVTGEQTKPNSNPPRKIYPKIVIILLGLVLLAFTFASIYKAGSVDAETQEKFFIIPKSQELSIPESQELAILRIYGDKTICASFDTSTKKVEGIFIYKLSDNPEFMPQLQRKGPLIPSNSK